MLIEFTSSPSSTTIVCRPFLLNWRLHRSGTDWGGRAEKKSAENALKHFLLECARGEQTARAHYSSEQRLECILELQALRRRTDR